MRLDSLPPLRTRGRRHAWCLLLGAVLLASCGGGSDAPPSPPTGPGPTPPPPPPAVGPPTSVTVRAGDGQTGDPGAVLAVPPSVLVRDSANRPVPNVAVAFAVDSGGGVAAGGAVTTGADGTATLGSWTLGASEGPQRLRATVGALSPVHFRATARVSSVTLPTRPLDSGGGPITFDRPGLPFDGTTLRVKPGALGTATGVALAISSAADLTWPAGMRAVSPTVAIVPTGGEQIGSVRLSLPIALPLSDAVVVLARDEATGALALMPTLRRTADRLEVAVTPRAQTTFWSPAGAPALASRTSQTAPRSPVMVVIRVDPALLAGDFETRFDPVQDSWPFSLMLDVYGARQSAGGPFSHQQSGTAPAMTAIWYYMNQRAGGPLRTRFMEEPDAVFSTRMGIRWNAWLESRIPAAYEAFAVDEADGELTDSVWAQQQMIGLKTLMLLSRNMPQAVRLYDAQSELDTLPRFIGVAYRIRGGTVDIALPQSQDGTISMSLAPEGWLESRFNYGPNLQLERIQKIAMLAAGGGFADALMANSWPRVAAGTFGNADGWPEPTLMSKFGELDPRDVVLLDTMQLWWECEMCASTAWTQTAVVPHPPALRPFARLLPDASGRWPTTGTGFSSSQRVSRASVPAGDSSVLAGYAITQPAVAATPSALGLPSWIDWQTVRYRTLETNIAPSDTIVASNDTTVRFTLTAVNPPAGAIRYRWVVRGAGSDSVETTTPTWTRRFAVGDSAWVIGTILHGPKDRPIGRDSVRVVVESEPWSAWRITSFTVSIPFDDRNAVSPLVPQDGAVWRFFSGALSINATNRIFRDAYMQVYRTDSARFARIASGDEPTVLVHLMRQMASPPTPGSISGPLVAPGVFAIPASEFAQRAGDTLFGLGGDSAPVVPPRIVRTTRSIATSVLAGPLWTTTSPNNCEAEYARRFTVTGAPPRNGSVHGSQWIMYFSSAIGSTPLGGVDILNDITLNTSDGTATGTWSVTYRMMSSSCGQAIPQRINFRLVRRGTFTAERIR